MRLPIAVLALVVLCFAGLPAMADTVYSNGPINGSYDAWTINYGFAVSETFTLAADSEVHGVAFGAWLFPGDVLESAEVLIGTSEFSGAISGQVVPFTQSDCYSNQYGLNVCVESADLTAPVNLTSGTYWLTLENAVVNSDNPVYWDENSGPSSASESSVGTIPSEAFTLTGTTGTSTSSSSGGTVPEPGSLTLMASGIFALAGVVRRKLF
jgi:hypothetical protein